MNEAVLVGIVAVFVFAFLLILVEARLATIEKELKLFKCQHKENFYQLHALARENISKNE